MQKSIYFDHAATTAVREEVIKEMIPYMGVNGVNLIKVIKIDKLVFNNKSYKNILLGLMDNISLDGVDVILNKKLLEE